MSGDGEEQGETKRCDGGTGGEELFSMRSRVDTGEEARSNLAYKPS